MPVGSKSSGAGRGQRPDKMSIASSADFQAANARRAALIKASKPREAWRPFPNVEIIVSIKDWDLMESRDRKSNQLIGHDFMLLYAISDTASPDHGKTYPIYYKIRDARDQSQETLPAAARMRQLLESALSDENKATAEDANNWSGLLEQIKESDLRFRGIFKRTPWSMPITGPDGKPATIDGTSETMDILGEFVPEGTAAESMPNPADDAAAEPGDLGDAEPEPPAPASAPAPAGVGRPRKKA